MARDGKAAGNEQHRGKDQQDHMSELHGRTLRRHLVQIEEPVRQPSGSVMPA
jgi:hypothetical protein